MQLLHIRLMCLFAGCVQAVCEPVLRGRHRRTGQRAHSSGGAALFASHVPTPHLRHYTSRAAHNACCLVPHAHTELHWALQIIHHFVEVLDRYFGNVCELDLIFNFHKV